MTPVEQITSLYIGYFGRAPDPEGLNYWVGRLADGFSLAEIAESFSVQSESQTKYPYLSNPNIASPDAFISQVYMNLFNRMPDAAGLAYWRAELQNGANVGDFILDVISGAQGVDKTIIDNKIEVGADFALEASNEPGFVYDNSAAAAAVEVINGVDETEASVDAGKAETDAFLSGGAVGEITPLTESVDTIVGGINNDTFVGLVDTGDDTFTVADDINGGGGTDTLRLTTTGDSANEIDLSIADISSVERLELRVADENITNINVSDEDGEFESISLDFRGGEQNTSVDLENASANTAISIMDVDFQGNSVDIEFVEEEGPFAASLSLTDVTDTEINIDFDGDSDGTSDADAITINLDNVQDTELDFGDMETISLNVTSDSQLSGAYVYYTDSGDDLGPQTINIALGADLTIDELDTNDDDDATFNISGAGNLDILDWGSADDNLTFNAEDATGNINFASINAGAESVTATFGAGDDRLTFDTGFDFTALEASGGAGNDTIGVGADDAAALADADLTSFETLELTEASSADVTVDADDNGFDNLVISADIGNDLVVEDLSGDLEITTSQAGTITITPEGASDDLDVTINQPGSTVALADLDVSGYTEVNFASTTEDSDVTDTVFTSLTVDGVDTLSFAGEGDVEVTALSAIDLATLDLTALTGEFTSTGAVDVETNVLVGNLDGTSLVTLTDALLGNDGTNVITFGAELDNSFELDGFEGGVGRDVLDLGALGVDSFGDLTVTDDGTDTTITSSSFDGEIVLLGVVTTDIDGTANFAF